MRNFYMPPARIAVLDKDAIKIGTRYGSKPKGNPIHKVGVLCFICSTTPNTCRRLRVVSAPSIN